MLEEPSFSRDCGRGGGFSNAWEARLVLSRGGSALLFAGGATIEAEHIVFDRLAPVAAPATVVPFALPANNDEPSTLGKVVQMSEFAAIRETLKACGGSRIETAKRLGISERTLRYRLAKAREQGEDLARVANS
jgi:two-component system response regulator FlrC